MRVARAVRCERFVNKVSDLPFVARSLYAALYDRASSLIYFVLSDKNLRESHDAQEITRDRRRRDVVT